MIIWSLANGNFWIGLNQRVLMEENAYRTRPVPSNRMDSPLDKVAQTREAMEAQSGGSSKSARAASAWGTGVITTWRY